MPSWLACVVVFVVAYAGFMYLLGFQRAVHMSHVPIEILEPSAQLMVAMPPVRAVAKQSVPVAVQQATASASTRSDTYTIADDSDTGDPAETKKPRVTVSAARLLQSTHSPEATTRRLAIMSLTSLPFEDALQPLRDALADSDKKVRTSALITLPKLAVADFTKSDEVLAMISSSLADPDPTVVRAAQNAYQAVIQVKHEHAYGQ